MTKPTVSEKEVLNAEELRKIDAYWRATLYLFAGMIFLKDNPLLKSFGLRQQSERLSRLSHSRSFLGQARRLG
jgi:xylulose-5-phosphate/fructose-6-phosphate phosphoketolase